MTNPKVFFYRNIRFLRERKKYSQEMLAQALEMSRNKLQALESGKTANPVVGDLIRFSDYFKISVDSLLKVDLSRLGELKLKELEAGNDVYMTGSQLRVLAISVDRNDKENVEYVPVKAKAGYRSGYNDPEFIAALPKFNLPNLPRTGSFRVFPISGDSMLPIPENSEIIARYITDWKTIKPGTPCIVILKTEQDFVFKLVTLQADGSVLLQSLNTHYLPYTVQSEDILEIWSYYKHQTATLPDPVTSLQEIKSMITDLSAQLRRKMR